MLLALVVLGMQMSVKIVRTCSVLSVGQKATMTVALNALALVLHVIGSLTLIMNVSNVRLGLVEYVGLRDMMIVASLALSTLLLRSMVQDEDIGGKT